MAARILLVDDEADFLDVFGEFLQEEGYEVITALNGTEALAVLEREPVNLLVSDINMPGMKGFELLREASRRHPGLRHVLITAYDVRDYLFMAKTYDIGNIITKTTPFNFDEIRILLDNIVTGNIFGLQKYIQAPITRRPIQHSHEIEDAIIEMVNAVDHDVLKRRFRQAAGEVVVNAFFYGGRNERGDNKELWNLDSSVDDDKIIEVAWAGDEEKFGVSVTDQSGRLSKSEILYWLERNSTKGKNGLSIGLLDEHGKGLFIAHETIDRLIVNIARGKKTEIILISYKGGQYSGHRPLWIQEL
jgi:CheY-like chemotaxis protein